MAGRQVFDSKGSFIGSIKDIAVNLEELDVSLLLDLKSGDTIEMPWSEIQSVEDVVLLKKQSKVYETKLPKMKIDKKEIEDSPPKYSITPQAPSPPPPPQKIICPDCGTSAPSHAKFCPKCGKPLK